MNFSVRPLVEATSTLASAAPRSISLANISWTPTRRQALDKKRIAGTLRLSWIYTNLPRNAASMSNFRWGAVSLQMDDKIRLPADAFGAARSQSYSVRGHDVRPGARTGQGMAEPCLLQDSDR